MGEFFAYMLVGFVIGYIYKQLTDFQQKIIMQKLQEKKPDADTLGIKSYKQLKHEIVGDVHYFYLAEDDTFVAQGRSLEEAAKHFTYNQGEDNLGYWKHSDNKDYCFVNSEYMELNLAEQH